MAIQISLLVSRAINIGYHPTIPESPGLGDDKLCLTILCQEMSEGGDFGQTLCLGRTGEKKAPGEMKNDPCSL